jgi:hypothetical protein
MPKKNNKTPITQVEFFETIFPGKLCGKEVVDKQSRRIGIIKHIIVEYLPWKVSLIVKGLNIEIPVDIREVENIGTLVQLKTKITALPEINVNDLIRIRDEVKEELKDITNKITF